MPTARRIDVLLLTAALLTPASAVQAADLEAEPIRYSKAPAGNVISRLQERIAAGQVTLTRNETFGYLPALLRELNVPQSSQVLVFSKTSFQRHKIGPKTPRALYFNDSVYVGFCQRGDVLEITAMDPALGAVFYSLDQRPPEQTDPSDGPRLTKPTFRRHDDACLICHGSSQTQGFPGNVIRSVLVDRQGLPILSAGSKRIDQTNPLADRWGGWYVTGTSGTQLHLGNLIRRDERPCEAKDNAANCNLTDLSARINTSAYLTPHSDIVALMVLEHQAEMHNRITRANLQTRLALYEEENLNKALGEPPGHHWDSTKLRIKSAGDAVLKYMLFCGEALLTERVQGTSQFAEEFAKQGPRDKQGRSLRDFDLERRLFRYPCSYLIYSEQFLKLPGPVKEYVLRRLYDVLKGKDDGADFAHLSEDGRQAILEILRETVAGLPDYWRR